MFEQRKARDAWLNGARSLQNNKQEAAQHFERALALDPGMADAWLGLHATGVREDEAITAMAEHEGRFGEERQRQTFALHSRFPIGVWVSYQLETHFQLWCAVACHHIERHEFDQAEAALRLIADDAPATAFIRGNLAFVRNDDDEAIIQFRRVIAAETDGFLEAEARYFSGVLLAEAGVLGPAKEHLIKVVKQTLIDAQPDARYWLGLIARAEGDENLAMKLFHRAYAERPTIPGLKEALTDAVGEEEDPSPKIVRERPNPSPEQGSSASGSEDPPETVDDVLADLNKQVGQPALKRQVEELVAHTRHQMHRREAGLKESRLTEHFVFTGPPGTGKTTIARVIARLYKALGILDGGHVVEVDKSDLVGEYLGHTPAKTKAKLDESIGGVLLIDEAYTLSTEGFNTGDAFGQEAIDTILKRMEDDRDSLVVIAAGYPDEMRRFIASNPGLRSRFTTTINFTPYSVDDLVEIGQIMAAESGDVLTPEALDILRGGLSHLHESGLFEDAAFGNARFVRNLLEKAIRKRSLRLSTTSGDHDISTLTEISGDDMREAGAALVADLRGSR
jgi:type VII secretion ATPase EccA